MSDSVVEPGGDGTLRAGDEASAARTRGVARPRKALLVALPWCFIGLLLVFGWRVLMSPVLAGTVHGYVLGVLFLLVVGSFAAAGATMTGRVLRGEYPQVHTAGPARGRKR